jgi:hypothetical protein
MQYRIKKIISNEFAAHSKYFQIQKKFLGLWIDCTSIYGRRLLYFSKKEAKEELKKLL